MKTSITIDYDLWEITKRNGTNLSQTINDFLRKILTKETIVNEDKKFLEASLKDLKNKKKMLDEEILTVSHDLLIIEGEEEKRLVEESEELDIATKKLQAIKNSGFID